MADIRVQIADLRYQIADSRAQIADLRFEIADGGSEISDTLLLFFRVVLGACTADYFFDITCKYIRASLELILPLRCICQVPLAFYVTFLEVISPGPYLPGARFGL